MKNIKNEKGAITIIVLVSILLMISLLISSYIIISNKVRTQNEVIAQTKKIYEDESMEEAYNGYRSCTFTVIPTPADAKVTINGKITNSIKVKPYETVSWTVQRNCYTPQSGTHTMETSDYEQICTLDKKSPTTVKLPRTGVSASGWENPSNANKDPDDTTNKYDNESYAKTNTTGNLTWFFGGETDLDSHNNGIEISPNGEITDITLAYKFNANRTYNNDLILTLKSSNGTEYFWYEELDVGFVIKQKWTRDRWSIINIHVNNKDAQRSGQVNLPTAADIRDGISLVVKKKQNDEWVDMKAYGAAIWVKYIEP